ncbi:hypothetical protein ACFQZT_23990 [Paenibacillus sp. GCM10027628]|uniref:hypothetical protein n=1 Tax=Paenibacillus sp. GCM10027628 TaxID=3273413 RepID=UPI0036428297
MGKEYRKTVPFGLHKKSVDLFLKKLHDLQEKELQELKERVTSASRKNMQLSEELNELRRRQRQERTKDLLEQTIQKTDESDLNPLIDAPHIRPTLKVVPLPNRDSSSQVEELDEHKLPADEEGQTHETNLLIEESEHEVPALEPAQSDLTVDVQEMPSKSYGQSLDKKLSPRSVQQSVNRTSNGFWGDADDYLDEGIVHVDGGDSVLYTEMPRIPQQQHFDSKPVIPDPVETSYKVEVAAGLQAFEEKPSSMEEEYFQEPDNSEISKIKQNYIVGKTAGENLLDRQGRLIIAKEAIITEEVIRRAQREGKLAELIVNMTISGLGE